MKFKAVWLMALIFVLTMTMAAAAQDETPAESPLENACYAGGSLEGKCDWPTDAEDEWAWTCGYHIAQFENGKIQASEVPTWCNYFAEDAEEADVPDGCYHSSFYFDLSFVGPLNTLNNVVGYLSFDGSCSGTVIPTFATVVVAADEASALTLCESIESIYSGVTNLVTNYDYDAPANWYGCG